MPAKEAVLAAAVGGSPFVPPLCILTQGVLASIFLLTKAQNLLTVRGFLIILKTEFRTHVLES
jgi:hypothetical protein